MKIIEVNKKQYILKLDFNALCDFKELTGTDLLKMGDEMDLSDIRAIFHLALVAGNPNHPTDPKVSGQIISDFVAESEEGFTALSTLLGELINSALGKKKSQTHLAEVTK